MLNQSVDFVSATWRGFGIILHSPYLDLLTHLQIALLTATPKKNNLPYSFLSSGQSFPDPFHTRGKPAIFPALIRRFVPSSPPCTGASLCILFPMWSLKSCSVLKVCIWVWYSLGLYFCFFLWIQLWVSPPFWHQGGPRSRTPSNISFCGWYSYRI